MKTKTALLFAMNYEAEKLFKNSGFKKPDISKGPSSAQTINYQGKDISMVVSGWGEDRARAGVDKLIEAVNPDTILMIGICGGTKEYLDIGEVMVADSLYFQGNYINTVETKGFVDVLKSKKIPYLKGLIESSNVLVKSTDGLNKSAIAVDMESYFAADQAKKQGVNFQVVRAVSDIVSKHDQTTPDTELCGAIISAFENANGYANMQRFVEGYF